MIGIDIVSLNHAPHHEYNGLFLNKVFTENEVKIINASLDPFVTLWMIWSAKEAAFKVLYTISKAFVFNWKKFEVSEWENERLSIIFSECKVELKCLWNNEYVCAVSNYDGIQYKIGKMNENEDQSMAVRKFTLESLSIKNGHIDFQTPPKLWIDEKLSSYVISLSHHGNHMAFAYLNNG